MSPRHIHHRRTAPRSVRVSYCTSAGTGCRGVLRAFTFALVTLLTLSSARPAVAQDQAAAADSTQRSGKGSFWWSNKVPKDHSPRGALIRAAVLPGWGQFYNRQYLKIPVVVGGLGAVTAIALNLNSQYLTFRHAYLYAYYNDPAKDRPEEFCECYAGDYRKALARFGEAVAAGDDQSQRARWAPTFRQYRDVFRRNRDLTYFGIGVVYGLTLLDAYVSANLLDFDVGEDLSLSVTPAPSGVSATLRLDLPR